MLLWYHRRRRSSSPLAPVASSFGVSVNQGGSVDIDVAAHCTPGDGGDALDLASVATGGGPAYGTLLDNGDGTLTYTHDGSGHLADSFTFTIQNAPAGLVSNAATVTVTVYGAASGTWAAGWWMDADSNAW